MGYNLEKIMKKKKGRKEGEREREREREDDDEEQRDKQYKTKLQHDNQSQENTLSHNSHGCFRQSDIFQPFCLDHTD